MVTFVKQQFCKFKRQLYVFLVVSIFRSSIMMSVCDIFHIFFINTFMCAWITVFYMQRARHIHSVDFTTLVASTYSPF